MPDIGRSAIITGRMQIDSATAIDIWERGLSTCWQGPPVWVHGDVSRSLQGGKQGSVRQALTKPSSVGA